jgi:hypothetical protein
MAVTQDVALAMGNFDAAEMDEEMVQISNLENPNVCGGGCFCSSNGDPHFTSFNGKKFDFQSAGEFDLAISEDGSFQVTTKQVKRGRAAVNKAVAIRNNGDLFTLEAFEVSSLLYVNDFLTSVEALPIQTADNGFVRIHRGRYIFNFPDQNRRVTVAPKNGRLNVHIFTGRDASAVTGLCGTCSCQEYDDFVSRDGLIFGEPLEPDELHAYGQSWATEGTSLFADPEPLNTTFDSGDYEPATCSTPELQAAAEDACTGLTGTVYDNCLFDICVTGDVGSSFLAHEATIVDDWRVVIMSDPGTDESAQALMMSVIDEEAPVVIPFITFEGSDFATIDNTQPYEEGTGAQFTHEVLPDGWRVCEDNEVTRGSVIGQRYTFGTECLVLASGVAISTVTGEDCGTGQLLGNNGLYRPMSGNKRVYMCRDSEDDAFDSWTVTAEISATDFAAGDGNRVYAVMTGDSPSETQLECQDVAQRVPDGFQLAPNDAYTMAFLAAAAPTFGTECLVLADGTAVTGSGAACPGGYSAASTIANHGPYYASTFCNLKLLLVADAAGAGEPNTLSEVCYDTAITLTHYHMSHEYALLDNTDPASTVIGCQTGYLRLPAGWSLAADTSTTRAALSTNTYGTSCVVTGSGAAYDTDVNSCFEGANELLVMGSDPACFKPAHCDSRILISRDADLSGILNNPSFDVLDPLSPAHAEHWAPFGSHGYDLSTDVTAPGSSTRSMHAELTAPHQSGGAYTTISYSGQQAFELSLACKASNVVPGGTDAQDFSLFVDIYHTDGSNVYYHNAPFTPGTHDWERVYLPVTPLKDVAHIFVHALFRNHTGEIWCDDLELSTLSGNELGEDGLFHVDEDAAGGWASFGTGFVVSEDKTEVCLDATVAADFEVEYNHSQTSGYERRRLLGVSPDEVPAESVSGAFQVLTFQPLETSPHMRLLVSAYCKATDVSGEPDEHFALYTDITFEDGSHLYGRHATCNTGTHDFEMVETVINVDKTIASLQVVALFRFHNGTACWKDVALQAAVMDYNIVATPGVVWGDPHLTTYDGFSYDFMAVGEFVLTADDTVEVQARLAPMRDGSVISGTAIRHLPSGVEVVVLRNDDDPESGEPSIYVNHRPLVLGRMGHSALPTSAGSLKRVPAPGPAAFKYIVSFPETHHAVEINVFNAGLANYHRQYLTVLPRLPDASLGLATGLLGNADGYRTNDLVDANGFLLDPEALTQEDLYGSFAEAHRVTRQSTAFVYAPGADTETHTDRSFRPRTIHDYTLVEIEEAEIACASATDPAAFKACRLDVLLTGDTTFGKTSAAQSAAFGADAPLNSSISQFFRDEDTAAADATTTETPAETDDTSIAPFALIGGLALAAVASAAVGFIVLKHRMNARSQQTAAASKVAHGFDVSDDSDVEDRPQKSKSKARSMKDIELGVYTNL